MATVQPTRSVSACTNMLDDNISDPIVPVPLPPPSATSDPGSPALAPAPPVPAAPEPPPTLAGRRKGHLGWAVPLAALGLIVPATALVTSAMFAPRWSRSPGMADEVGHRLRFENLPAGVTPEKADDILFVTITTPHLTLLQWLLANHDGDVIVQDHDEVFGRQTPDQVRQINLESMYGAKQIAEYVAYKRLGLDATFNAGKVEIEQMLCVNGAFVGAPDCTTPAPAAEYLKRGSVILAIDGVPTPTTDDLAPVMSKHQPGDLITVKYLESFVTDESQAKEAQFATIASPDDPKRPLVGFVPHDTRSVTVPYETSISTSQIGGPSAGLAFTLTLIDALSPGRLTGGHKVAVTGEILEDGTVGAIGGLHQKTIAVKQAGADFFLVPAAQGAEQIADARAAAGSGLEIIPVANVEEALAALLAHGGDPLPPLVQG